MPSASGGLCPLDHHWGLCPQTPVIGSRFRAGHIPARSPYTSNYFRRPCHRGQFLYISKSDITSETCAIGITSRLSYNAAMWLNHLSVSSLAVLSYSVSTCCSLYCDHSNSQWNEHSDCRDSAIFHVIHNSAKAGRVMCSLCSLIRSVCHSFVLYVSRITHERVNGRRLNMVGVGKSWPSKSN